MFKAFNDLDHIFFRRPAAGERVSDVGAAGGFPGARLCAGAGARVELSNRAV